MRKIYIVLSALLMQGVVLFGQSYLAPEAGYRVAEFLSEYTQIGAFDINEDRVYIQDGDTIHVVNALTGEELRKYGEPADYQVANYASFLTISPDNKSIWAGYTSDGNADDRIYSINMESGTWTLEAKFPGNYDLIFWKDSILVSGLNSATWGDPNGIYLLDTTGMDQHRLIVEVGGNSAGMAIDTLKNLYYGTSFSTEENAIYSWSSTDLEGVLVNEGAAPLQLADGLKLTDVPAGISDCEIDEGFNLVFTMNLFGSPKVLALWNGLWNDGNGYNLDTLAVASGEWDWLGSVKSMGDFTVPSIGGRLLTFSFGQPLVDLHSANYPPIVTTHLPVLTGYENKAIDSLDLTQFVTDPDSEDLFTFQIEGISNPAVADLQISGEYLVGTLGKAGQTNVLLVAASGEEIVELRTTVGTWPDIQGDHLVSDMDELALDPEAYWNGSDQSGAFTSGAASFHNSYNPDWFSWSGWAHSNVTDNTTPGWMNQYSAYTGMGFDGSENYAVGYATTPSVISFTEDKAHAVEGFFVTNSTYAGLSMRDGDDFTKKFGGEEGNDPDFFRLDIWGARDGKQADTVSFYLADFRSEIPYKDYIVNTWQWVDLSSLGKVDSLEFALSSSDNGDWGMNTPGYFCLDQLYVIPDAAPYVKNPRPDITLLSNEWDTVINLSTLFSDPDDGDDAVELSILSNSNEDLLEASLEGKELTLRVKYMLLKSVYEEVEIIIEGASGGLKITDSFVVSIEQTGDVEGRSGLDLKVYPNPTSGSITIHAPGAGVLDVSILSISGSIVYQNTGFEAGQTIDLSHLTAGPYMLRIKDEKGLTHRMIQKL